MPMTQRNKMRILSCLLWLFGVLCADPFYYGVQHTDDALEFRLYGIMNQRANINGEWIKEGQNFTHNNQVLLLKEIQDSCVILQEKESVRDSKVCLRGMKIIEAQQ